MATEDHRRFDDIVRTERYFTATLLPAILFHGWPERDGVKKFLKLVDEKTNTERTKAGTSQKKGQTEYGDLRDVQLITEFHIARDLKYAGLKLDVDAPLGDVGEEPDKKDAPDVLLMWHRELVVCEGKFFNDLNTNELKEQLKSQRRAVRHLFCNHDIRAYRHVAIMPMEIEKKLLDADAVLTWSDIRDLANSVMGEHHYVTARLREAVARYNQFGDPNIPNFDGRLPFNEMRERCRRDGSNIQVGHADGAANLRTRSLVELERKSWKWRDPRENRGNVNQQNWLWGTDWLKIVERTES